MVSGMGHCSGGIGPNTFGNGGRSGAGTTPDPDSDLVAALERWVEHGTAPERLIGSGTVVADPARPLTRPLCAYPKVARYKGSGDPYVADSQLRGARGEVSGPAGPTWMFASESRTFNWIL